MSAALDFAATARALASGETTAEALASGILDRIGAENSRSHIFISTAAEMALEAARRSDERRLAGALLGPLDGMPIAVKDNIAVAGLPKTDGTFYFRDRIAAQDAGCVARLRAAGAVIIGTLNMHEGALGATTDNPFWGQCQNPLADGFTPGGSSGGSGAAVAAGLVPVSLGTDTMGSVRIPAAYCGVWGLKPTRGLVPTTGLSLLSWTLDSIGPLASSAEGLRITIAAMAGFDREDASSLPTPPDWQDEPSTSRKLTLGIPAYQTLADCEPAVASAFESLLDRLDREGIILHPLKIDGWRPGEARRAGLLVCEAEAGMLLADDLDSGRDGFSDDFRSMLSYGRAARAEKLAGAYRRLMALGHQCRLALNEVDAILMPTAPQRAFAHGKPAPANQADFTALANISGCPAVAFPLPALDGGLPASAQLMGAPWTEMKLLALAERLSAPQKD